MKFRLLAVALLVASCVFVTAVADDEVPPPDEVPSAEDLFRPPAAPSEAQIVGPDKITPGTLAGFAAATADGQTPAWFLLRGQALVPSIRDGGNYWWPDSGGRTVLFSSADQGGYLLIMVATAPDKPAAVVVKAFTVGNPLPPGPEPGPNPPGPGPDDGPFGLAKLCYRWAADVAQPAEASTVADCHEATAAAVAAGTLAGPGPILADLRNRHAESLTAEQRGRWATFAGSLNLKLSSLYTAGNLSGAEQWAECLREIGRGVRAAAK